MTIETISRSSSFRANRRASRNSQATRLEPGSAARPHYAPHSLRESQISRGPTESSAKVRLGANWFGPSLSIHSDRLCSSARTDFVSLVNSHPMAREMEQPNQQKDKHHQQSIGKSEAASQRQKPSAPTRAATLLQLCLVLIMLLSSTTTTNLVNGIKLQPEGKEKFYWSGEQFVITCQNNNNIKNVKIRWTGPNGNPIQENRKERIRVESNGNRLVINNAQLVQDDGQYTCTITEGQRARESTEFHLKVLKETNFKNTAKVVTLKTNSRSQLDCHVEFDPSVTTASVTWLKGQQPVDLLNDSSIKAHEYDASRQLATLTFNPVRREHEDEYTCQATAVTPNLSKIIDHKIQVEVQFQPIFDTDKQTIWVESIQAIQSRLHAGQQIQSSSSHLNQQQYQHQQQQQQQQQHHRNTFGSTNLQRGRGSRLRQNTQIESSETTPSSNQDQQVVRVELNCTCQANPDANIMWFVNSDYIAVAKGQPEHVIENPVQERSGHNVTSTLVVAYNLDPSWPHRHDNYRCSASNLLGSAEKSHTIEQGNPPPTFSVGPQISYSPQTTEFNFTLIGPIGAQSQSGNVISSLAAIVPPVDSFRIRAESGPAPPSSGSSPTAAASSAMTTTSNTAIHHHHVKLRPQPEQSVHVVHSIGVDSQLPVNLSVKLGELPSGPQRLYLDAHNAVGYSSNSTYLGQFNLVSSALPSAILNAGLTTSNLLVLLLGQLFMGYSYLMRFSHS